MNTLKDLVNKVYSDLQTSNWIIQYPELSKKKYLGEYLEALALANLEDFISEDSIDDFENESEENFKESTFKKYIKDYSKFLNAVENEFYNWLILWLVQ